MANQSSSKNTSAAVVDEEDSNFSRTRYNLDVDSETGLRIKVGETDVSNRSKTPIVALECTSLI